MTRAERIALYEQVTGRKMDPELIRLERENPYAAKVERERREHDRRVAAQLRGRALMDALTPRKYAVGFDTSTTSTPKRTPRTLAEEWRLRVERRRRYSK